MHPILRNLLAVIAGLIVGSIVNMALVTLGTSLIPPPEGHDMSTTEGLAAAMEHMQPVHFLFPFLAHALGTLSGAWLAARLSSKYRLAMGLLIGLLFFAGGLSMIFLVPSPTWFSVTDLLLAYFPMAFLGAKLAVAKQSVPSAP